MYIKIRRISQTIQIHTRSASIVYYKIQNTRLNLFLHCSHSFYLFLFSSIFPAKHIFRRENNVMNEWESVTIDAFLHAIFTFTDIYTQNTNIYTTYIKRMYFRAIQNIHATEIIISIYVYVFQCFFFFFFFCFVSWARIKTQRYFFISCLLRCNGYHRIVRILNFHFEISALY